mmetsp:Transcript_27198/g.59889  ORF Transcript_27198/g.59889 Transcript_27198/m.59889 type:complete len:83 (-) Transcript_27198:172-420(-)
MGCGMERVDVFGTSIHGAIPQEGKGQSKDGNNGGSMIRQNVDGQIFGKRFADSLSILGHKPRRKDRASGYGGHPGGSGSRGG